MLPAELVAAVENHLHCSVGREARPVAGGSIHTAVRLETSRGPVFLKYTAAKQAAQLDTECDGLKAIAQTNAVRTPKVLAVGATAAHAYAAFEWIELQAATPSSDARLGEQLAKLHGTTTDRFGWHHDNFIGATPQRNAWCAHWVDFWRSERLGAQLRLAQRNGASASLLASGARLEDRVSHFFAGYTPVPSLIHGDLWAGNRACDEHGEPVIFDPAVYFGDREAELAMCHLFGGFHSSFARAYETVWPLASGARVRRVLYQLYHVLNHFNLFGGGYQDQAERMTKQLLAEAGA